MDDSGHRAPRLCAEQETPGSQTENLNRRKGVTAMVKQVFSSLINNHPAALAILGWLAFVCGVLFQIPISFRLLLLSAARVLP
jgi:hypothetical protein